MHVAQAGGALGHPWRQPSNLLTITGTLMAVGRECSVFRRGPVSGFSSLCLLAFAVRWIREAQGGLRGNAGRFIVRKGMVQTEKGTPFHFRGEGKASSRGGGILRLGWMHSGVLHLATARP